MKKLLSFIMIFVLLSSVFVVPAFAADDSALTISEDYKYIYYNGKTYCYVDDESAVLYWDTLSIYDYELSEKQKNAVEEVYLEIEPDYESFIRLYIYYKKGGLFNGTFIEESYLDEYESVLLGQGEYTYTEITYGYTDIPDTAVLTGGESFVLTEEEIWEYDVYFVYTGNKEKVFCITTGQILVDMSTMEFYYTEYSDLNDYNAENTVYKITDEELLKSLTSAYNSNYFGYDYSDSPLTKIIFLVIVALILGLVPLAILVLGIIFLVKSKKPYKKYMITIISLVSVELIAFIILFINLLIN